MQAAEQPEVEPSTLRLFFALWPDESTRLQLAQWRDALHGKMGGRPMQADDLHLTLCFLGDMPAEMLVRVQAAVENVRPRRFALGIDAPACWTHNHIVWAGPKHAPAPLLELANELREALRVARIGFDAKFFVPHVTLIRKAEMETTAGDLPRIEWPVDRFVLVSSKAGRPRYRVEREWVAKSGREM